MLYTQCMNNKERNMKTRNPIARNTWKFNKPKVVTDKKKEQRRKACRKKEF